MDRYTDSFNDHADSLREKREQADFDNLQHTLSGVQTGQQTKHGLNNEIGNSVSNGKGKSVAASIRETLDWLLLNDAAYRQAHENLMDSIRSAQTATQTALEQVLETLQAEQSIMDEILSNAAKLPDGTRVFKDKNGNVRNEDGEIIPPEAAATIEWTGHEPSYEEYVAPRQHIKELEAYERELRGIETEIGEIHERGNRNDEPLTPAELGRDADRVDELEKRVRKIENNAQTQAPQHQAIDTPNEEHSLTSSGADLSVGLTINVTSKP
ncbi:MAG: hypothetical protein AAGF54_13430 [Pseudomonadota bacterium]